MNRILFASFLFAVSLLVAGCGDSQTSSQGNPQSTPPDTAAEKPKTFAQLKAENINAIAAAIESIRDSASAKAAVDAVTNLVAHMEDLESKQESERDVDGREISSPEIETANARLKAAMIKAMDHPETFRTLFELTQGKGDDYQVAYMQRGIANIKEQAAVWRSITDVESAKAAVPAIARLTAELKGSRQLHYAIGDPMSPETKALVKSFRNEHKLLYTQFSENLIRVSREPELHKIIEPALEAIEDRAPNTTTPAKDQVK